MPNHISHAAYLAVQHALAHPEQSIVSIAKQFNIAVGTLRRQLRAHGQLPRKRPNDRPGAAAEAIAWRAEGPGRTIRQAAQRAGLSVGAICYHLRRQRAK